MLDDVRYDLPERFVTKSGIASLHGREGMFNDRTGCGRWLIIPVENVDPVVKGVEYFDNARGEQFVALSYELTQGNANYYTYGDIDLSEQDQLVGLQRNEFELELVAHILDQSSGDCEPDIPTAALGNISYIKSYTFNRSAAISAPDLWNRSLIQMIAHRMDLDGVAGTTGVLHSHRYAFPDNENMEAVIRSVRDNTFRAGDPIVGIAIAASGQAGVKYQRGMLMFKVHKLEQGLIGSKVAYFRSKK